MAKGDLKETAVAAKIGLVEAEAKSLMRLDRFKGY